MIARVGFDIGGTWARAVQVGPDGGVLASKRMRHGIGAGGADPALIDGLLDWLADVFSEPRASARAVFRTQASRPEGSSPWIIDPGEPPTGAWAQSPEAIRHSTRVDSGEQERPSQPSNLLPTEPPRGLKPAARWEDRNARDRDPPIGVAVAGIVSADGKAILRAVNLQPLEGTAFVARLEAGLQRPVRLFTDAHAATWAEYLALPPPRPSRFVHLRLGTGVALGEARDGRYVAPARRGRHHPDLLIVDDGANAPRCACGLAGCLEAYLSTRRPGSDAGRAGWALHACIDAIAGYLADGCSGDAVILIGGGRSNEVALMSTAGIDLRAGRIQWSPRVAVAPARLGDGAAAVGAALLTAGG
ncbi:MAG: ROK family protein [Phycisphaerales bacterium]|nr:MAG: ROK family protein [Phycisphaerales bacterium]